MAASDNPEEQIMEVTIGYRIFNGGDFLRADRVQMFVNKTQEVNTGPFALTR